MATLPGAWRSRVSAGTGWSGVSILWIRWKVGSATSNSVWQHLQLSNVHLARKGFQDCVMYCLQHPTLVYFAVLQPGLFSVYCLIHCTTTRTTFSTLLYCNQDCSLCIVSYTVQPLGPHSVLCCTATRTVLCVLSHTLYNH